MQGAAKHLRFKQLSIPVSYWYYCVLDAIPKVWVLFRCLNGESSSDASNSVRHVPCLLSLTSWTSPGWNGSRIELQDSLDAAEWSIISIPEIRFQDVLPPPMPWQAPLDSSLTSVVVICKNQFTDTSLIFRQLLVSWKVTNKYLEKKIYPQLQMTSTEMKSPPLTVLERVGRWRPWITEQLASAACLQLLKQGRSQVRPGAQPWAIQVNP